MQLEKEHVVPLSDAAIALYERLPRVPGNDLLFPAPEGGELTDAAISEDSSTARMRLTSSAAALAISTRNKIESRPRMASAPPFVIGPPRSQSSRKR
jgi:hypothetical protein